MDITLKMQLSRIANTSDAEASIYEYCKVELRSYVSQNLPQLIQGRVGVSDITHAAAQSAIKKAKESENPIPTEDFRRLLYTIAKRKIYRAIRDQGDLVNGKNSHETMEMDAIAIGQFQEHGEPIANELANQLKEWILEEKDFMKRTINYLGIIEAFSPNEIHRFITGYLAANPEPGVVCPIVRTIQTYLKKSREDLLKRIQSMNASEI